MRTDESRPTSAEMLFMTRTAGYTVPDHNINEAITENYRLHK
jgi:hypothetical protein